MKNLFIFLFLFGVSCTEADTIQTTDLVPEENKEVINQDFQALLDSAGVKGSILIFSENNFYSNDFEWAKTGHLPASTFKIPNSIIALELGVMEDDSTLIPWDGEAKRLKRWEQDLFFRDAFHASCVPCYQEIARKVGVKRMKKFTSEFKFGEMIFDSTNLDMFWLEGASLINQFQQISFLKAFNEERLSISKRTHRLMSRLMIIEENEDYTLRGKTGWSVQNDQDNCWFVGYVETKNESYYFATNIEPKTQSESSNIGSIRKEVSLKALEILGLINKK
ncbi:MAG: class D beta-lactamase [Crocinitomicaceae bacterium]|nr:class D beta-lactamase [Flavobacteriales bacterium]NQZ35096.1 class D beta-lactamase [Crocinitomicaceae bacterium]